MDRWREEEEENPDLPAVIYYVHLHLEMGRSAFSPRVPVATDRVSPDSMTGRDNTTPRSCDRVC